MLKWLKTLLRLPQRGVRDLAACPGTKRLRALDAQFRYTFLDTTMFCDVMHGPCKSLAGSTAATVFATNFGWVMADPIKPLSDVHHSLDLLHETVGIPREMRTDNVSYFTGRDCAFRKRPKAAGPSTTSVDPHTQKHNQSEAAICELQRKYKQIKA